METRGQEKERQMKMSFPLFNGAELDWGGIFPQPSETSDTLEEGSAPLASGHEQGSLWFCLLKKDVTHNTSLSLFLPVS